MTLSVDYSQINFSIARVNPCLNENNVPSRICRFIYISYFITINQKNELCLNLLWLNILSIHFFRLKTSLKQQHFLMFKHFRKLCKIHDNNLLSSVLIKCSLFCFSGFSLQTHRIYTLNDMGFKNIFSLKK